jgi:hypothetical protein
MGALYAISVSLAATRIPLSGVEDIRWKYDSQVSDDLRGSISNDLVKCLAPYTNNLELFSSSDNPSNTWFWLEYFTPYGGFAAINGLGPRFPEYGTYSNGVFTINVSYAFATNYQHHIETTAAYSNEIAAAYTFIESLSPTNLQTMSTTELLSMDLWKEVPPGQHPSHDLDMSNRLKTRFFPPPRLGFFVWDCGPSNNPPYLWCHVPAVDNIGQRTIVSFDMMIFYQNRWWFSAWPLLEGEQQW